MTSESEQLDLERTLAVLRHRWWMILLLTVIVAGAAYAFSETQGKKYTATTTVLFENPQLSQEESGLQATQQSPSSDPTIMATNIQLLTQQAGVASRTARAVGHGLTASAVTAAISISQQGQTDVANVSATSADPRLAADIANTYVAQFIAIQTAQQKASVQQALRLVSKQVAALSPQQLAGTDGQALVDRQESLEILATLQDGGAQVVTAATAPTVPSSPKVKRDLALGVLLGLLLGLVAAFISERLDTRMKTVEDLEATYNLPVLATVPHNRRYTKPSTDGGVSQHGEQEVFRLLRAYLRYFNVDREIRSLVIASAAPGDGKTTVAYNLAHAAQETGTRTLLIDADLRRSRIAALYEIANSPGLSEFLVGDATAEDSIRSVPIATRVNGRTAEVMLDVLVAGHAPPNPAELIESKAMADVLSWAAEHYDLVVIDTPPLSVVSDAIPLLTKVDGALLVSQVGKNTRDAAAFLRERLVGIRAPLLGVVANGINSKNTSGYGYGYGYGEAPTVDTGTGSGIDRDPAQSRG